MAFSANKLTEKAQEAHRRRAAPGRGAPAHPARAGAPAPRADRPGGRRRAGRPGEARRPAARRCSSRLERGRRARWPRGDQPSPGLRLATLPQLLEAAQREAERLKDEYVSTEHFLLALADDRRRARPARSCARPASPATRSTRRCSRSAAASASPARTRRATYQALEKYGRDLTDARPRGQARPGHRARRGDPPRHPGAVAGAPRTTRS